jgi:hypothetical protein
MSAQPDGTSTPRTERFAGEGGDAEGFRRHSEDGGPLEEHRGWVAVVKHELRQVGLVSLYFLVCFGIILTLKKLFLADYQIEFYALSVTVISALIAGKVVVILDKTPIGTRFDTNHPLAVAVVYKTMLYSVAAFAVLFGENLFHAYRATGRLGEAIGSVWAHRDGDALFAKMICVALAFVGYHFYAAIDGRLGEGTLRRMVWSRR